MCGARENNIFRSLLNWMNERRTRIGRNKRIQIFHRCPFVRSFVAFKLLCIIIITMRRLRRADYNKAIITIYYENEINSFKSVSVGNETRPNLITRGFSNHFFFLFFQLCILLLCVLLGNLSQFRAIVNARTQKTQPHRRSGKKQVSRHRNVENEWKCLIASDQSEKMKWKKYSNFKWTFETKRSSLLVHKRSQSLDLIEWQIEREKTAFNLPCVNSFPRAE